MRGTDSSTWECEYEVLAAMLRGAPRVPWSAPKNSAARRAAVRELVVALEDLAQRTRDERSRELWSRALVRAQDLHQDDA